MCRRLDPTRFIVSDDIVSNPSVFSTLSLLAGGQVTIGRPGKLSFYPGEIVQVPHETGDNFIRSSRVFFLGEGG